MPYITLKRRQAINPSDTSIKLLEIKSAGELNFTIQLLAQAYLDRASRVMGQLVEPDYAAHNAVLGAMEAAKLEYYRRVVAPYEDTKIAENGDVF